jgi:DNA recombination protein RmuC
MTSGEMAILVVAATAVALLVILIWVTVRRKPPAQDPALTLLQEGVQGLGKTLTGSLTEMKESVGELRERSQRFLAVAADIASLDNLLRAPKARGGVGEIFLENLLSQVLPGGAWDPQVDIGGKRVDAVVRLGDRMVAIDAKFPVEDFRRLADADEGDKARLRKDLIANLKGKAEDIAGKYIRPDLGTYDFALMYIPAEAVYYEVVAVTNGDFFDYATQLRVFPVSPTTTYLYLCTIALGLKGLVVEERAEHILSSLARLEAEWKGFENVFKVLGTHVRNTYSKYDEAVTEFSRVTGRLAAVSGGEPVTAGDE